jgi:large subunit ribosomal protein L19
MGHCISSTPDQKEEIMKNKYISAFESAQIETKEVPSFRAGDTLKLGVEIKEGAKTRVQNFEGVVIALKGEGVSNTFTIRKIGANGVGVERIFPLYSDSLKSIEVLRCGKVRRAKLHYLRTLTGKKAKIQELRK